MIKKTCPDCGPLPKNHFEKYVESFSEYLLPELGEKWANLGERVFVQILSVLRILKKTKDIPLEKISLRTGIFIQEGRKRGWDFWAFKGPAGYLNVFEMRANGKNYFFEGLPRFGFSSSPQTRGGFRWGVDTNNTTSPSPFSTEEGRNFVDIDDKAAVKKILLKNNLPAPEGKFFWIFNQGKVVEYGLKLGFPLVVKPRSGSMSHHVTANIKNETELRLAIKRALKYEPTFVVEKCLTGTNVYRATVVGKKNIACVQRIPANIVGDGIHSINQLIEIKNQDSKRGLPRQKNTTLYRLVINETSHWLLKAQGFGFDDIVPAGKSVYVQEKIILDLGADLFEVTSNVHEDNIALFKKVAEIFGVNLVGIDFLAEDISRSFKEQKCGIIELNSLPYIDMHHFPSQGEPVNVAGYVCDMVVCGMVSGTLL